MQQKPGFLDKTEQSHASSSFQTPDFEEISNQGPNLLLFESPRETMLDNIKQYFDSASNVGRSTLAPLCETDQNCNHAQERITYVQEAGKYECAFCGQTYGSSGELLAHLRAVHAGLSSNFSILTKFKIAFPSTAQEAEIF
ncbi:Hypothetical predicted protein [Cloeon dipterum]|uniref:C2H2-type domain-containing protein n=1 Tax=Cloeon dipterum TaxID=197152 RepID=A0A8S1DHJ3_9INSE|nr:Hypothetical predicted protein [Cloeon dipterum]